MIGHRHYSLTAVRSLSQNAGLSVARLELRGGLWEVVHMNVMYVSKWIFRRRPFFERQLVALSDREWQRPSGFVHVFLEETREYYGLDRLWADAPRVDWASANAVS